MFHHTNNVFKRFFQSFYKQIIISIISIILLFTTIGIITTAKPSSRLSPSIFSSWTGNVDQSVFSFIFSMENRAFDLMHGVTKEHAGITSSLLNVMTSIKMGDLKSFLGHEIPGFSTYENKVIIAGEGLNDLYALSHESGPPLEDILEDRKAIDDSIEEKKPSDQTQTTEGKKVVFLYNSHNRESFLPHLPDESDPDRAYHEEVNITKVSENLANALESNGIGTLVDDTDIMSILHENGWTYGQSYTASRPVVEEAISQNEDFQYAFDIHRDSFPRDKTTKDIDGESYAKLLFVIGAENKNYEKNLELATDLHYLIDEKYPGLSKGIVTKEGPNSNGVYNQDLLENALLLEIGGYENTLEEMYRTADVVAEAFSELYWEAEQVSN